MRHFPRRFAQGSRFTCGLRELSVQLIVFRLQ